MNEKKVVIDGIEVDVATANKILRKIIILEKMNLKAKTGQQEIIKKIKDKIAEEVTCF